MHPANAVVAARQVSRVHSHKKTRVMFCIDNMQIGGTELNALRTAERLNRTRFDVSVICLQRGGPRGPLVARYEAAGIPVIPLPLGKLYGVNALRQGLRLAMLLRRQRVDIFHAHDFYSNIFGICWARLAGTPAVIASRRWWTWPPGRVQRVLNRLASRLAHRVLTNSPAIEEMLHRSEGFPRQQVVVIPNFADDHTLAALAPEQRVRLLREFGVPARASVIGAVAGLNPVKDHATLLRAVALMRPRWPELHVVIVGGGPCRCTLETLADRLDLGGRVHFTGIRHDGPRLHQLFDVSVLCSLSEGVPNTLLEAMAQAVPVVATDVGGTRDLVSDGTTGLLVPPAAPERLAAALDALLTNPARARAMALAAQRHVRDHLSAGRVVASLEALYSDLVRQT